MTQLGSSPLQAREVYPLAIYNGSGEEAPAFAAMEVTAVSFASEDRKIYAVRKPTGGDGKQVVFNGPVAIPNSAYGRGADAATKARVSGSPSPNSTVGPVNDSWSLAAAGTGFVTRSAVGGGVEEVASVAGSEREVFYATADEDIATGAGGDATVQSSSTCSLSDGDTITVCNKTGRTVWQDAVCEVFKAPDGTYHIIRSDSASIVDFSSDGPSNSYSGHGAVTGTTGDGIDGREPASSVTISNPFEIDVMEGDQIAIAGDAPGEWYVIAAPSNYPGCGLMYVEDGGVKTHEIAVDAEQLAGVALEAAESGCALDVQYGCGLTVSGGALVVDAAELVSGDSSGLTTDGTCGIAVSLGCGLTFDGGGSVSIDNTGLAGYGLTPYGECSLAVDEQALQQYINVYIQNNIQLILDQLINYLSGNTENQVEVVTGCSSLEIDGDDLVLTMDTETVIVLGRLDTDTTECSVTGSTACEECP